MSKYRKKPVVIDAVQFKGASTFERLKGDVMFLEWKIQYDEKGDFLIIPTLEGDHRADVGDWIITGVKGETYPCKSDIFAMTYEPAE